MPNQTAPFSGIPQAGLDFLAELPTRDKEWFHANRSRYQETLLEPTKSLIAAIGKRIQISISKSLQAKPAVNGSLSPIFRDLRFSSDKTIFKDHLLLNFWDGPDKKTAPTLRIRIAPDQMGFATGSVFATVKQLDQWRRAVEQEDSGNTLQAAIDSLKKKCPLDQTEPELKKVPTSFDPKHPRADLLRCKSIQLRWHENAPPCITHKSFADWCSERLERTRTIHLWFTRECS